MKELGIHISLHKNWIIFHLKKLNLCRTYGLRKYHCFMSRTVIFCSLYLSIYLKVSVTLNINLFTLNNKFEDCINVLNKDTFYIPKWKDINKLNLHLMWMLKGCTFFLFLFLPCVLELHLAPLFTSKCLHLWERSYWHFNLYWCDALGRAKNLT